MNQTKTTLLFYAVLLLASSISVGQEPEQSARNILATLTVKHAALDNAQEVLEAVLEGEGMRLIVDENSQKIMIVGSPEAVVLAKNTIAQLDEDHKPLSLPTPTLFTVQNANPIDLANTISDLLGHDFRMSADTNSNVIAVVAEEAELKMIAAVISRLDEIQEPKPGTEASETAAKDCNLRISWLVDPASFPEEDRKELRNVRPSLQKVVEQLKLEGGVSEIVTLTDVQTLIGDEEFSNASVRDLHAGELQVLVSGAVERSSGTKNYELQLALDFTVAGQQVSLESHFKAPANHPVAFSVSDIGGIRSYLIVEVTASE